MLICENINKIYKKKEYQIIGIFTIAIVVLLYSYNYFANTFPYSDGWFVNYVELLKNGNVPYRDFFYYLPPLNLLIDSVFWKLSFGYLLAFRAWYLLERILLYILVYRLLCRFFSPQKALLATCISTVLCTADDFDFFGDYNQNVAVLAVLITYFAVDFVQHEAVKNKKKSLFLAGIILGLMFLTKQTIFIACGIVFFLLLIYFCVLERDKNIGKYIFSTAIGVVIPILICIVILIYQGALLQCIDQLFTSSEGKGSLFDILVTHFVMTLKNKVAWIFAIMMCEICWLGNKRSIVKMKLFNKIILIGMNLLGAVYILYNTEFLRKIIKLISSHYWVLPTIVVLLMVFIVTVRLDIIEQNRKILLLVMMTVIIGVCVLVMFSPRIYHAIYNMKIYYIIFGYFSNIIFYFLIMLFIYLIIQNVRKKKVIEKQNEIIMIAAGGLALNYATTMAAGLTTMASNSMRISLPLVLSIIFSLEFFDKKISECFKTIVLLICIIGITACISQKSVTAYPWWGMKDKPKEEKIYTIDDIKYLKGFKFSEEDKEMYEEFTKLISDNTSEDDIIFGYPYIKIYNILCERYNTYFVPVFWYDVVGDKYVDILVDELNDNLPQIVIWYDIPGAIETHEAIYRNGKYLEQRKIVELFDEVLTTKYECLAEYNDMYLYKLQE